MLAYPNALMPYVMQPTFLQAPPPQAAPQAVDLSQPQKARKLSGAETRTIAQRQATAFGPKGGGDLFSPLTNQVASPALHSISSALWGGLLGAAGGLFLGFEHGRSIPFALGGSIIGGAVGAFSGAKSQAHRNQEMLNALQHLPEGATLMQYESIPAVQARNMQRAAAMGNNNGLMDAMMMGTMMSGMSRPYSGGNTYNSFALPAAAAPRPALVASNNIVPFSTTRGFRPRGK